MEIKAFETKIHCRYDFSDSDTDLLMGDLKIYHEGAKSKDYPSKTLASLERELSLSINRNHHEMGCGTPFGASIPIQIHEYVVKSEYTEPVEFTKELADFEMGALNSVKFKGSHSLRLIYPSDLKDLNIPWSYEVQNQNFSTYSDKSPKTVVKFNFVCKVPEDEALKDLKALVDQVYLPTQKENGDWELKTPYGTSGGQQSDIDLMSTCEGKFTAETGKEIIALYKSVKEVVLNHRLIEEYRIVPSAPTWEELVHAANVQGDNLNQPELREMIEDSTAINQNTFYAPSMHVEHMVPSAENDSFPTQFVNQLRGDPLQRIEVVVLRPRFESLKSQMHVIATKDENMVW